MEQPTKIVIGKTWFYVSLVLLFALFLYLYRCHKEPLDPKLYQEPPHLNIDLLLTPSVI